MARAAHLAAGLAAAALCGLTAGPNTFPFLRANQITRLTIGPVHAQSVVLGADPQGKGSQRTGWGLAVGIAAGRLELLQLLLQLVDASFQLFDRSACVLFVAA